MLPSFFLFLIFDSNFKCFSVIVCFVVVVFSDFLVGVCFVFCICELGINYAFLNGLS